ncbi:MAG TPA: hypothetical protein VFX52_14240 [Nocardioidaceae bacterium]|jgi:hypothetical protein|nr:hypothetical protein [Nocardioidaceae bacterium]
MPSPPCPPSRLRCRPALSRALTPVVVSLALAASACGGTSGGDPSARPSPTGTGSPTTSATPTTRATPTTQTTRATPTSSAPASPSATGTGSSASPPGSGGPRGLRARLLGAAQVPGLDGTSRWVVAGTGPEPPGTSFGTCQRFALTSIGAERAAVRRFVPEPPVPRRARHDRAGELVATFPDALTARRAYAVLEAWQRTCAARLSGQGHTHAHVGDLRDVPAGDRAGWYQLAYGPVRGEPGARFLDAQGVVLSGSRLAMVSLVHVGPHGGTGQQPMVTALRRAAHRLGTGR